MKGLANVLLTAMSYFVVWGEDYIDQDIAAKTIEDFASELSECKDEEIYILVEVAMEMQLRQEMRVHPNLGLNSMKTLSKTLALMIDYNKSFICDRYVPKAPQPLKLFYCLQYENLY